MAVQFRSVATATSNGTTSFVVNKPSQTADGDVLIATIQASDTSTISTPAGWTLLGSLVSTGGFRISTFKKIAASEPASWTWTFSVSSVSTGFVASFVGGWDVLHWAHFDTGTDATQEALPLDASRDGVGFQVAVWRNATSVTSVTGSFGQEEFDLSAGAASPFRGMAGYYYGPSEVNDIVNAGDQMPSPVMTVAVTPTHGAALNFIIADKEPDDEKWSSTNGDFAVEVKLDEVAYTTTGSVETNLTGDITGKVAAISSSGDNPPNEIDDNLADGLATTKWLVNAATGTVTYDFGVGVTKTVRRYRLTSANDTDGRDPMNWTLEGSQNASSWTVVDTRTNEAFGNRMETREFKLNGTPAAYRYYRLNITSNQSGGALAIVQLAEWRLSDINVWEDITSYVQEESKIRITRGIQSSSGRADFSRAYCELKNTDGRFSLRNSNSPYYGALRRNSKLRISKAYGTKSLQLQGDVDIKGADMTGDGVQCTLTSSLALTGDIDVRIDVEPKSWRQQQMLAGVQGPSTVNDGWVFYLDDQGKLNFKAPRTTGAAYTVFTSTVPVPQTALRQSLKVTFDIDNGSGGATATFSTSDSIGGSYTQLGATVTDSGGVYTIPYRGGALHVGHTPGHSIRGLHGLAYNFELRNGIAGTLVTDLDFTALTNGAHTFTDSNSNNWITVNNAVISNRRYRFHGEVAEWPLYWDPTGQWVAVSITAGGVQKRLERGNVTQSVMRRYHTKGIATSPGAFRTHSTAFAYWPMEDMKDSTTLASGLPGKPAMFLYGQPLFGESDGEKFHESEGLPKLNSAKYGGPVIGLPANYIDLRWLHYSPTDMAVNAQIIELYSTGSLKRFVLDYPSSGNFRLRGYNESDDGSVAWDTGSKATAIVNELAHCQLILDQSGANIAVTFNAFDVYGNSIAAWTDTFLAATLGRVYRCNANPAGDIANTYIGHVAAYSEQTSTNGFPVFAGNELNAGQYETAGNRILRICQEEDIEFRAIGGLGTTQYLGFQDTDTPFNIMSSAAVADDGYLIDPLDSLGLLFRTNRSLYGQPAAVTLSYSGKELDGELRPVEDDSYINNDFTASRGEAGSARFQETEGTLSILDPPDGVNAYEDSGAFSFASDGQCTDMASWQVHKGTLDEERYQSISIALENLRVAANAAQTEDILLLDIGQRIDITNPPVFLPGDDIRQIVIGYEETFDKFQHGFSLTTLPERTYEVAAYGTDSRFAQTGSTLFQDITSGATSIRVANQIGQPWSNTAAAFSAWIDGEKVTVTGVANYSATYSTDSFNRADSTTVLGSTDGGTISAWTQRVGTWGINTNRAYVSVSAISVATIPGAADFEEASVTVQAGASGTCGVVFRFTDTSNYWWFGGAIGGLLGLNSVDAGVTTTTTPGEVVTGMNTLVVGDKLMVRAHGTVIECFRNGKQILTISSATRQTQTPVGMYLTTDVPRLDNYTVIASNPSQSLTVTRNVNGRGAAHKSGAAVRLYNTPYRGL